jgi:hypothetical protein
MGNFLATLPHIDPETDQRHALAAKEQMTNAAASSTLDRDPYALRKVTGQAMGEVDPATGKPFSGPTGVPWVDQATTQQVQTWNTQASARIAQLENRKQAASDEAERFAGQTFNELQGFVANGSMPTPEYTARVRSATAGTSYAAAAESALQVAAKGAGFGAAPLPAQRARIAAMEAVGAKGTDPQQVALLQQFRTISANQQKAYADDPWDAVTRFGNQPPQPVMNIMAPDGGVALIAQRRPMMGGVETYAGVPVSPLHPAEATQWRDQLAKVSVPQRAELLAQGGTMLNGGQIAALADQLAPKGDSSHVDKATALMLKVSERTGSGRAVAERIGIGAQGLADGTIKADQTKVSGWQAEIATMLRGALGSSAVEDDAIQAATYVRAAFELPAGTTPGYASPTSNEDAVTMVVGQPIERAGVKTILPRRMSESEFDAKLRTFTPEVLKGLAPEGSVYSGGRTIPLNIATNRLTQWGMRYYGPGVYAPVINNAIVTVDKQGTKPLLLKVQ